MDNRPIGVFDSGLGGLTAVKELKKVLPNEDILYFGDTGRVPYGTRSRETIIKYATQDMNFLIKNNVKAVVAACGTVSSVAKSVGEGLSVPYIDVLTPTAMAASIATKNKKVGVTGTSATIGSGSFVRVLHEIDSELQIFTKACPMFVPLVENGFVADDDEVTKLVAQRYLREICENGIDTLILGCTHFPIISHAISLIVGKNVTLIDSGRETANYLTKVLREKALLCDENKKPTYKYFVSDNVDGFKNVAQLFLGCKIDGNIERIDIEKY